MTNKLNIEIVEHVERDIVPQYDAFDRAHNRSHVQAVIAESLRLAQHYDVNYNIVYIVAAYHDLGLSKGRETHHTESARIVREADILRQWFSRDEIATIAEAVEDHRASNTWEPRSIYGRIVAEADRQIEPDDILRRAVQYGLDHYPEIDKEGQWERMRSHMKEKYAEGGYMKLYLPESNNARQLSQLRAIIADERKLRTAFEDLYRRLTLHQVRLADVSDLSTIMSMVSYSRELMRAEGNTEQWVNGYPSEEAILKDIGERNGYIIYDTDGNSLGYFAFIIGDEPTYNIIYKGSWYDEDKTYGTIHRLAKAAGTHNIANSCLSWCKSQIDHLRLDTHKDNLSMQRIAASEGFVYRGIILVADGTERKAYQWGKE